MTKQVKFDINVALVHEDERRAIYEPERVLEGLEGKWYAHNFIIIKDQNSSIENHYHDYTEVFFGLSGRFKFVLTNSKGTEKPVIYTLKPGSRLCLPEGIVHRITGLVGSTYAAYGNVKFDPRRFLQVDKNVILKLEEALNEM